MEELFLPVRRSHARWQDLVGSLVTKHMDAAIFFHQPGEMGFIRARIDFILHRSGVRTAFWMVVRYLA